MVKKKKLQLNRLKYVAVTKTAQGENMVIRICGKLDLPKVISFMHPLLHVLIHTDAPLLLAWTWHTTAHWPIASL